MTLLARTCRSAVTYVSLLLLGAVELLIFDGTFDGMAVGGDVMDGEGAVGEVAGCASTGAARSAESATIAGCR